VKFVFLSNTYSSERIACYKYYNIQPAFVKATFSFSHVEFSHIDVVKLRIIYETYAIRIYYFFLFK